MVSVDSGPALVRRPGYGTRGICVFVLSSSLLLAAVPCGQAALRVRDALQGQKPRARRDGPQTGSILSPGLIVRSAGTVPIAHAPGRAHPVGRASGSRRVRDPDGSMAFSPGAEMAHGSRDELAQAGSSGGRGAAPVAGIGIRSPLRTRRRLASGDSSRLVSRPAIPSPAVVPQHEPLQLA